MTWSPSTTPNDGAFATGGGKYSYQNIRGGAHIDSVSDVIVEAAAGPDDYSIDANVITTTGGKQKLTIGPAAPTRLTISA